MFKYGDKIVYVGEDSFLNKYQTYIFNDIDSDGDLTICEKDWLFFKPSQFISLVEFRKIKINKIKQRIKEK